MIAVPESPVGADFADGEIVAVEQRRVEAGLYAVRAIAVVGPEVDVEGLGWREVDGHAVADIVIAGNGGNHRAVDENRGIDQAAHGRDVLGFVGERDWTQDIAEVQGWLHATDADLEDVLRIPGLQEFRAVEGR